MCREWQFKEKIFDEIWIQPASGDGSSGAALVGWHKHLNMPRKVNIDDSMKGTYLGCKFSNKEIISYLRKINAPFQVMEDHKLFDKLAGILDKGDVVGWFNGPMELDLGL